MNRRETSAFLHKKLFLKQYELAKIPAYLGNRTSVLVKCVFKEQKKVGKKYEVISRLMLNGHSFHWELWLMRESISSIVAITLGYFLKTVLQIKSCKRHLFFISLKQNSNLKLFMFSFF